MKRVATICLAGVVVVAVLIGGAGSFAYAQGGGGTATPAGPQAGAPGGFVLAQILCDTPVFDVASGLPVPNTLVRAGQTWFVSPLPYGIQQAPGAQPLTGQTSAQGNVGQGGVVSNQQGAQFGQTNANANNINIYQGPFGQDQPGGPFMVSSDANLKQQFVGSWTQIYVGSASPTLIPTSCVAGQQYFARVMAPNHIQAAFYPVGGSGITGSVILTSLPNGGTFITVVPSRLQAGESYISLTYNNPTCTLESYSQKDIIGGAAYTANANGAGGTAATISNNLSEIQSVSVRRASDFALLACAAIHSPGGATQQSQSGQGGQSSTQSQSGNTGQTGQTGTGTGSGNGY